VTTPGDQGERGERLATLPRNEGEELRVSWDTFKGFNFLSLRVWSRGSDGAWRPTKTGVTIKRRELATVADAMARAVTLAEESPAMEPRR